MGNRKFECGSHSSCRPIPLSACTTSQKAAAVATRLSLALQLIFSFIHGNSAHFTLNCRENFWRQGISGHHEWPNYLVVVWNLKKFQSLVLKTWWMESPWCQTVYSINSEGPGES